MLKELPSPHKEVGKKSTNQITHTTMHLYHRLSSFICTQIDRIHSIPHGRSLSSQLILFGVTTTSSLKTCWNVRPKSLSLSSWFSCSRSEYVYCVTRFVRRPGHRHYHKHYILLWHIYQCVTYFLSLVYQRVTL